MEVYKAVEKIAVEFPTNMAVNDMTMSLNYAQLINEINSISESLNDLVVKLNIKKLALIAKNGITEVEILIAASKINLKILTINPELKYFQMQNLAHACGVSYALIRSNTLDIERMEYWYLSENWIVVKFFQDFELVDDGLSINEYLITGSSGSTGNPKPLVFSQQTKLLRMQQSRDLYGITITDKILNASPIFHSLGQRLTFLPLMNGAELVILNKFSAKNWLDSVLNNGITFTIAVSTHLQAVLPKLNEDEIKNSNLRSIVSSSAGINKESKKILFEHKTFDFYEQYGASEVATVTNCNRENYRSSPDSIGKLCKNVEMDIRNKNEENIGEIFVKSNLSYSGYMKNGKLVQISKEEYIETGDIGSIDSQNLFHFKGRIKEIINVGGQNVYPVDIVRKMQEIPQVKECVVIGVPDNYFGEKPIAFLSISPEVKLTKLELNSWCMQNLPNFQRPHDYVIMNELPKLPSGKYDILNMTQLYSTTRKNRS